MKKSSKYLDIPAVFFIQNIQIFIKSERLMDYLIFTRLHRTAKGFTFLEILIALLILGSSITIIYGLQTASVSAAIHDSQLQKAILIARSIMSQIESVEDTVENVTKSGTAFSVLDSINAAVPDKVLMKELETFQTDLAIEYWNIPGIEEIPKSSLRRVRLVVSWGETERDKAHFYYFIPKEPDSQ